MNPSTILMCQCGIDVGVVKVYEQGDPEIEVALAHYRKLVSEHVCPQAEDGDKILVSASRYLTGRVIITLNVPASGCIWERIAFRV